MTTTQMPASAALAWCRNVGIGLLVIAGLVLLIGWPRTACGRPDFTCRESGSEAAVWVGLSFVVASLVPLAVFLVSVGTRLALRAEREAAVSDQVSGP